MSRLRALIPYVILVVVGTVWYIGFRMVITPAIQTLYLNNPNVFYAPSHFGDARQYVLICNQGYNVPSDTLPTLQASRLSWMPVYAGLQCVLHWGIGISLVYTGITVSAVAMAATLIFGALALHNLNITQPALHAMVVLVSPVGAAWLYLPAAESTFLFIGMTLMYGITLPPLPDTPRGNWETFGRVLTCLLIGILLGLTKPNALALILPLCFAFIYRSWQVSCVNGYRFGVGTFVADVILNHASPLFFILKRLKYLAPDAKAPAVRYDWLALVSAGGIGIGFAYWLSYSSLLSGVRFYFLDQQLNFWGRAWSTGNIIEMLQYYSQVLSRPDPNHPWAYEAAWNLGAIVSSLIPAASKRVPMLIRGMLVFMVIYMLLSGTAHYATDRYIASTALVLVGWGCWLEAAPGEKRRSKSFRWGFVLGMAALTSYLLIGQMIPSGEPKAWGIQTPDGVSLW